MSTKKLSSLLVFDGRHLLWRSFDAFSDLAVETPKGYVPTGAIYGFLSTALRVHHRYGGVMVVAWEGTGNFRHELYPAYKARDEPTEDELDRIRDMREQERRLMALLRLLGVRQYFGNGGEADDAMGWLATRVKGSVALYSGDSDLAQLVKDGRVKLISPQHRGPDRVYREADVLARWGVPPKRIPDLKALAGDPSDGIPGLSGIGPKTAAKAIEALGSLPKVIRAAKGGSEMPIPERHRGTIITGEVDVTLYRRLTTIRTDLKPGLLEPCADKGRVVRSLMAYRFRSLLAPAELAGLMRLARG